MFCDCLFVRYLAAIWICCGFAQINSRRLQPCLWQKTPTEGWDTLGPMSARGSDRFAFPVPDILELKAFTMREEFSWVFTSCFARGRLQGRPLQPLMGWGVGEELTKSWPTFEQLCVQNLVLAISCCFSPTRSAYKIRLARSWPRVGHGLANFWHDNFRVEIAGVFLVVLWQHPITAIFTGNPQKMGGLEGEHKGWRLKMGFPSEIAPSKSPFAVLSL